MNKTEASKGKPVEPADGKAVAAAKQAPLQPPESADESPLQSIANAITAPVRDAAEDEERKQTGQPRKP